MVMVAKGNRAAAVREACRSTAASISPRSAARREPRRALHQEGRDLEYPELGMEAIWRIEVVDFPAFIVIDDKAMIFSRR
jgi:fumarate hydratase class I